MLPVFLLALTMDDDGTIFWLELQLSSVMYALSHQGKAVENMVPWLTVLYYTQLCTSGCWLFTLKKSVKCQIELAHPRYIL